MIHHVHHAAELLDDGVLVLAGDDQAVGQQDHDQQDADEGDDAAAGFLFSCCGIHCAASSPVTVWVPPRISTGM